MSSEVASNIVWTHYMSSGWIIVIANIYCVPGIILNTVKSYLISPSYEAGTI